MAMGFSAGGHPGLTGPVDGGSTETSPEDLKAKLAAAEARAKALEEQTKLQRESFLALQQQSSEQMNLLRSQLASTVQQRALSSVEPTPTPAPTDSWEAFVQSLAGDQPSKSTGQHKQQQASQVSLSPDVLKQTVRHVILEEDQAAQQAQQRKAARLQELVNTFNVQYPDYAANKAFQEEVNRVYVQLEKTAPQLSVDEKFKAAIEEAGYITTQFTKAQQQQSQRASGQQGNSNSRQASPINYMLPPQQPAGIPGMQSQLSQEDRMAVDMRMPHERFRDYYETELRAEQERAAQRTFGPNFKMR